LAKISVIIPVFNAKDYIARCIDSLIKQTIDDIELIFIDDCGSDNSIQIARQCLESYSGTKEFCICSTPQNGGPGAARNVGIAKATGDYICFVDSDDTVEPTFCEKLYNCITSTASDISCCDIFKGKTIYSFPECSDKRFFLKHFITYCYAFIYRRDFIIRNNILFPPTRSAEDSCFLICCILAAEKIAQINEPLYHYTVNENSVSRTKNRKRALQRIKSFKHLREYAKNNGFNNQYCAVLSLIMVKKCYLMAIRDLLLG